MRPPRTSSTSPTSPEAQRLAALRRFDIVGTPPDERFERVARLARALFDVPVALVTFITDDQQWCKVALGGNFDGPREHAFCDITIRDDAPLVVPDATADPRFADNLYVTDEPGIRFYAGVPLVTQDGHRIGSLCVIDFAPRPRPSDAQMAQLQDLGAMVMSELELRVAKQHTERTLESISDGFFSLDADWRFTYVNQEAERLLERPRAALLGSVIWEMFPEAIGTTFHDEYQRARADGVARTFEAYHPPLETWFRVQAYPYEEGLSVFFEDVTTRREREAMVRRYARRLEMLNALSRTLLTAPSPDAIARQALDELGDLVPAAWTLVLEAPPADDLPADDLGADDLGNDNAAAGDGAAGDGAAAAAAVPPSVVLAAAHGADAQPLLEPGTHLPLHGLYPHADALPHAPAHASAHAPTENGVPGASPGAASPAPALPLTPHYVPDLDARTDRRRPLERTLHAQGVRSYVLVPTRAEGRTVGYLFAGSDAPDAFADEHRAILRDVGSLMAAALQQARRRRSLVAAKEEAEEMGRVKASLLANMSHEIRTPLTAIIGFADVLGGEVDAKARAFVERIQGSARRLKTTLTSVLELAQLEDGEHRLVPAAMDVMPVARRVAAHVRPDAEAKGLALRLDAPCAPVHARADAHALERVLVNLAENAVKFTDAGVVTLRVRPTREGGATLAVRDTGVGMAPSFVPQAFDEFKQESEGIRRSHEGAGLGLTITRRLLDLMGATIDVTSTKGEGSTFTVTLPPAPDAADPTADTADDAAADAADAAR